jgi:hypothetical protein
VTPSGAEPLNKLSLLAFNVRIGGKFAFAVQELTEHVAATATAAKDYFGGLTGQFNLGRYVLLLHIVIFLSADGASGLNNQTIRPC